MKLHYPLNPATGVEDATQLPWTDGVPATGQDGSFPSWQTCVYPMQEIVNSILATGLTASDADLTQLLQAIMTGLNVGTFGGTADALTGTIPGSVVIPALIKGMAIRGTIEAANATAAPTLAITEFGTGQPAAIEILKRDGTALVAGDLPAGVTLAFRFDGTHWRVDGMVASDIATNTAVIDTAIANYLETNEKPPKVTIFSGNGTWTPDQTALYSIIETKGAGAGGGGGCTGQAGGGGGQGATARKRVLNAGLGPQPVNIGAGGAPGIGSNGTNPVSATINGGAGGTTSVGAPGSILCSASGGFGTTDFGGGYYASIGGLGGSIGIGDEVIAGGDGQTANVIASNIPGGTGGGNGGAGSAIPSAGSTLSYEANGRPGEAPGSGGGGGSAAAGGYVANGGMGAIGRTKIIEYYS